jgi:hypothetical protein
MPELRHVYPAAAAWARDRALAMGYSILSTVRVNIASA